MVFFVFTWSQKFWAKNNVLASKQSRSSLFQTSFQLSGLIFSRDHLLGKVIFRALSCLFRLSCHFLIRLKKTHTQVYVAQPVDGRCLQSTTSGYLLGIQTCPNPSSGTRRQSRIILESFTKLVLCSLYNFLC